jgi:hypothetical protein
MKIWVIKRNLKRLNKVICANSKGNGMLNAIDMVFSRELGVMLKTTLNRDISTDNNRNSIWILRLYLLNT